MSKEQLQQCLEELFEFEKECQKDQFNRISHGVTKYKEHFGEDNYINAFVADYLNYRKNRKV